MPLFALSRPGPGASNCTVLGSPATNLSRKYLAMLGFLTPVVSGIEGLGDGQGLDELLLSLTRSLS